MSTANCFSCGASFSDDSNKVLSAYKMLYDKFGEERYFYRLHPQDTVKICSATSFKFLFDHEIKPNLSRGAEYAHISEYR